MVFHRKDQVHLPYLHPRVDRMQVLHQGQVVFDCQLCSRAILILELVADFDSPGP